MHGDLPKRIACVHQKLYSYTHNVRTINNKNNIQQRQEFARWIKITTHTGERNAHIKYTEHEIESEAARLTMTM